MPSETSNKSPAFLSTFVLDRKDSRIKEMTNFEDDLANLLKNIKFRVIKRSFRQQLTKDIRTIKNTKTIFADKASNVYNVPKKQYEKLVNNAMMTKIN